MRLWTLFQFVLSILSGFLGPIGFSRALPGLAMPCLDLAGLMTSSQSYVLFVSQLH